MVWIRDSLQEIDIDPLAFAMGSALLLAAVGILASFSAHKATTMDPIAALYSE